MPIHAECPECGASYTLADDQSGKKVRCKKCQEIFTIGAQRPSRGERSGESRSAGGRSGPAKAVPAAKRRPRDEEEDYEDDDRARPSRRREAPKKGAPLGLIIGGSVAAGVLIVGGVVGLIIWAVNRDPNKTNDSTANQVAQNPTPIPIPNPQQFGPIPGRGPNNVPPPNSSVGQNPPPTATGGTPPSPTGQPDVTAFPNPKVDTPVENVKDTSPPPASSGSGELNQGVLDKVKKSTVYIRVEMNDGQKASGSGFFGIENGLVLTNAHVVDMLAPESRPPKKIEVILNSGTAQELILGGAVQGVDRDSDLAVLKVFSLKAGSFTTPPPLPVKPASNLMETQRLYVSGFPLGEGLGKEISIRPSQVASFRKTKDGHLDKIQVEGGMTHGNSGGPVVDSRGDVVGVAVSGFDGLNINFAIPGDNVQSFVAGRFSEYNFGQAYMKGKDVVAPIGISMLDPLNHIKDVALEVWAGNPDKPRPGAIGAAPAPLPTDSPHQKSPLDYQKGEAKGDVVFPIAQAGKEYWIQPSWTNSNGKRVWATATVYKPASPPVERRSAKLVFQPKKSNRRLLINTSNVVGFGQGKQRHSLRMTHKSTLLEQVTPDFNRGLLNIDLSYNDFKAEITVDDEPPPPNNPLNARLSTLNALMRQVSSRAFQDGRGKIQSDGSIALSQTGLDARAITMLKNTHEEIIDVLESLSVPLPNEKMEYGKSWVEWRVLQVNVGRAVAVARIRMLYTYLGTCRRNGREECVVSLEGQVRGQEGYEDKSDGKLIGTANIDLATGAVLLARAKVGFDFGEFEDPEGNKIKIAGRQEMELQRPNP